MVEQWDTEEYAALTANGTLPESSNISADSYMPPVLTKTWFHTGAYLDGDRISTYFANLLPEQGGYYQAEFEQSLLPDTILPSNLTAEEVREACRSLKGAMLRQEVYAQDGSDKAQRPYTVTEQNFTIKPLQMRFNNRHAVFFTHAREAISYHYERNPTDPCIGHAMTLQVDNWGNVLKSLAIDYGRRQSDLEEQRDQDKQTNTLITYTENSFTNAVQAPDAYRSPLPAQVVTNELTGFEPQQPNDNAHRFTFNEWTANDFSLLTNAIAINYEATADKNQHQKRIIEQAQILYRRNDLTAALPLGLLESLALPYESYKLAFLLPACCPRSTKAHWTTAVCQTQIG